MLRYLLKFVSKEAYADDLLNGKLFMHCAKYYHDLEKKYGPGQGDLREGSLFPNAAIYRNIYFPIYCMYLIKDEDISDGKVIIDKRVIEDFDCQQGFMVIILFNSFERVLPTADTGGYAMNGAEVWYGVPTQEDIVKMLNSEDALNLIVKHPYFRYQKEYRLIVYKNIYEDNFPTCLQDERTYTCCLASPITDFAKKEPISSLKETDEGYILNLTSLIKGEQNAIIT